MIGRNDIGRIVGTISNTINAAPILLSGKPFEHNRDRYTQSKTVFVREHTLNAKMLYGRIY
ncbi:MAG: hypothetical protein ACERKN_18555 [Velocimicrobium sp.]